MKLPTLRKQLRRPTFNSAVKPPLVILGLNQPIPQLVKAFTEAQVSVVKGFMVGRSVWAEPALVWLKNEITDDTFCQQVSHNFDALIRGWNDCRRADQ